ncbi:MAG: hypothetical protein ACTSVO_12345 [Candidatus Heimdallarchaeaceae archaeon]
MISTVEELVLHLKTKKPLLCGEWINKNSSYEKEASNILVFNFENERYWDCEINGIYIEIKKGRSIWLDEVRYCEILLKLNDKSSMETITMFLIPSKNKETIDNIYLVNTKKIVEFMKIDEEWADILLKRKSIIKHSLNCQQNMTLKDLSEISDYKI